MRRGQRLVFGCVVAAALEGAGCRDATQSIIVLEAGPTTSARTASLRVRVCGAGDELRLDRIVPGDAGAARAEFPARVPIVPQGGDATRTFALLAEALDERQVVFNRQRIIAGFVNDESRSLRRVLSDVCIDQLACGRDETCENGVCVPAQAAGVTPGAFPCDPALACVAGACPERRGYEEGFVWNRMRDWQPGTIAGASRGNPSPDARGNPTWQLELVRGGASLGDADPWYTQPSRLLVWDDRFYDNAEGAWARGDNLGPDVARGWFDGLAGTANEYVAVVRWMNPTGREVTVDLRGQLQVLWQGGATAPVELVVAHADAKTRSVRVLAAGTLAGGGTKDLPVELVGVTLGARDSIVFSGRGGGDAGWFTFLDRIDVVLTSAFQPRL